MKSSSAKETSSDFCTVCVRSEMPSWIRMSLWPMRATIDAAMSSKAATSSASVVAVLLWSAPAPASVVSFVRFVTSFEMPIV